MAVIGSINDRLLSAPSVLFAKTVIDAVIVMIMTSALGKGCIIFRKFLSASSRESSSCWPAFSNLS